MKPDSKRKRQWYLDRKARKWPKIRQVAADWRDRNRDYLHERDRKRRIEKRAMCLVAAARVRARRKGLTFDLGPSDVAHFQSVIDEGRCELTGIPFTLEGPRQATSPSLDRIRPAEGYVSGNCRVVCFAINAAMGHWGEDELRRIIASWFAHGA